MVHKFMFRKLDVVKKRVVYVVIMQRVIILMLLHVNRVKLFSEGMP